MSACENTYETVELGGYEEIVCDTMGTPEPSIGISEFPDIELEEEVIYNHNVSIL